MTKSLIQTYTFAHEYRRTITSALIMACIVCVLFYMINLYRVVSQTVALQKIASDSKSLNVSVQALDAQYLGISKGIDSDTIRAYGYNQARVSVFIPRISSGRVAVVGHEH